MHQTRSRAARRSVFFSVAVFALGACTDFSSPPPSLGRVTVKVTAANETGVQGLPVDLLLPNKTTVWRAALTSTDGTAEFAEAEGGVIPQNYVVRLTFAGKPYVLAADETNDKAVTAAIGATQIVSFRIVRVGGTTPGT